jgi:hypothetical protein
MPTRDLFDRAARGLITVNILTWCRQSAYRVAIGRQRQRLRPPRRWDQVGRQSLGQLRRQSARLCRDIAHQALVSIPRGRHRPIHPVQSPAHLDLASSIRQPRILTCSSARPDTAAAYQRPTAPDPRCDTSAPRPLGQAKPQPSTHPDAYTQTPGATGHTTHRPHLRTAPPTQHNNAAPGTGRRSAPHPCQSTAH